MDLCAIQCITAPAWPSFLFPLVAGRHRVTRLTFTALACHLHIQAILSYSGVIPLMLPSDVTILFTHEILLIASDEAPLQVTYFTGSCYLISVGLGGMCIKSTASPAVTTG